MNQFLFYGTLRSRAVLEKVISGTSKHLELMPVFVPDSELRVVVNEEFPVIVFSNKYKGVQGTLVRGLKLKDISRILFFEDVEFTPQLLTLEIDGKKEKVKYFSQKGVKPSDKSWSFEEWRQSDEKLSVITAELWMELYEKFTAEEANQYWNDIKKKAIQIYQSQS